ncbi:MAG: amino acid ABC transporter permease, partial [Shinella sp.]|uniref:amino acid ABC transporter permease n=1 Tax=Shinella sp. TaxID=1870904 RepID=UPI0040375CC1
MLFAYSKFFLIGAAMTVAISLLALLAGGVVGVLVALLRRSRFVVLRLLALCYVEVLRSTPIVLLMFVCYFGTTLVLGFDISGFEAAALALSLASSAMMPGVIRGGIASVGQGQWQAARAAGFTPFQVALYIVAPQAVRVIIPPTVGVYVATVKDSSVASIVGIVELTKSGLLVRESIGMSFASFAIIALIYIVLNYS